MGLSSSCDQLALRRTLALYAQTTCTLALLLPCKFYSSWRRRLILGWFPETKWIRGCWFLDGRLSPLMRFPHRWRSRSLPPTICASAKQIIAVVGWLCAASGGTWCYGQMTRTGRTWSRLLSCIEPLSHLNLFMIGVFFLLTPSRCIFYRQTAGWHRDCTPLVYWQHKRDSRRGWWQDVSNLWNGEPKMITEKYERAFMSLYNEGFS